MVQLSCRLQSPAWVTLFSFSVTRPCYPPVSVTHQPSSSSPQRWGDWPQSSAGSISPSLSPSPTHLSDSITQLRLASSLLCSQGCLGFQTLLHPAPECWDYKHVPHSCGSWERTQNLGSLHVKQALHQLSFSSSCCKSLSLLKGESNEKSAEVLQVLVNTGH